MASEPGKGLEAGGLETALAAIRATDRFRSVEGTLIPGPGGATLTIKLDPWQPLRSVTFRGDEPISFRKRLFPELRKGIRPGDFRIQRWKEQAQQKLRDSGYPMATVRIWREDGGSRLVAEVLAGPATVIRGARVEGDLRTYAPEKLLKEAGIKPGKSLWTADLAREAQIRLRRFFVKKDRLQGQAEVQWDEASALLVLKVNPGPVVKLRFEGSWLWSWSWMWKSKKDLVPLAKAGAYDQELLDEGDQRILRYLRDLGYLDATVTHRLEVLGPDKERITYLIEHGAIVRIERLRFEGNNELSEKELLKAAALPKGWLGGSPPATPELITTLEGRIKARYQNAGYSDLTIRRPPLERKGDKATLVFQIREKAQRLIRRLVLDVPEGEEWHPWSLAECLTLLLCDRPVGSQEASLRRYHGDRKLTLDVTAELQETRDPSKPGVRRFTLVPSRPLPFLRNDLALIYSALRQRSAALGASHPISRPVFEDDSEGTTIRFEVQDQARTEMHRLAVQGSDRTEAKAVFRELQLDPGGPLSADRLSKAQSRLGGLGVFQRIEPMGLGESVDESQNRTWDPGDLLLRTAERPPWLITSAFGYDKSQGYHVGLGVQRLNVGGMGRTVDMGIRAGDSTINSETMRKIFPTGAYDRSVDVYNLGYTDPWFAPDWLPDRTRLHAEAAYIDEHQDVYRMKRRRMTGDLNWHTDNHLFFTAGYRFERAEVSKAGTDISEEDLILVSRNPGRSIISAPYFQFVRDTRDSPLDPMEGSFSSARLEIAAQAFGTSNNSGFVKLDLRQQWHIPIGFKAAAGVVTFGMRIGVARPTASSSQDLPLSERFFAGGPNTHRGVEPDTLGPYGSITLRDPNPPYNPLLVYDPLTGNPVIDPKTGQPETRKKDIPLGGQALALINLEYRFPLFGQSVWGELFVDSGQVYQYLQPGKAPDILDQADFPPFRTAFGCGLIFKVGIPIKIEYAADVRRILGQPRTQHDRDTQLKSLLVSAGFQF